MRELTGQGLGDLLVDDDIHVHTALSGGTKHVVKTVLLIASRRPTQIKLRAQPPVENVDAVPRLCSYCELGDLLTSWGAEGVCITLEGDGDSPKVRRAIDMPLDIARRLRCERGVPVSGINLALRLRQTPVGTMVIVRTMVVVTRLLVVLIAVK